MRPIPGPASFTLSCCREPSENVLLLQACDEACWGKARPWLIDREQFAQHPWDQAAEERGLECACVNSDDFTVLVSGGGRHH